MANQIVVNGEYKSMPQQVLQNTHDIERLKIDTIEINNKANNANEIANDALEQVVEKMGTIIYENGTYVDSLSLPYVLTDEIESISSEVGSLTSEVGSLTNEVGLLTNEVNSKTSYTPALNINQFFRVNQRGESVYNIFPEGKNTIYTVDRIRLSNATNPTMRVLENKTIEISGTNVTSDNKQIINYYFEEDDVISFLGQTVCISINVVNVVGTVRLGVFDGVKTKYQNLTSGMNFMTFTWQENCALSHFALTTTTFGNYTINFASWKFEQNDFPTPHIEEIYATDLSNCERYTNKLSLFAGAVYPSNASEIIFPIPVNQVMRRTPTLEKVISTPTLVAVQQFILVNASDISIAGVTNNTVYVKITGTFDTTKLYSMKKGEILVNAEL